MTPFLLAFPWLLLLLFARFVARVPSELPVPGGIASPTSAEKAGRPSVSIVVPARNEALNIEACLGSLGRLEYPDFEIIVVDDRSEDGTGTLARVAESGNASRLVVVDGDELPDGWLGKPWACHQGAGVARGEVILFTDADTTHGPALLSRAVLGLDEEEADLLTVVGRQLMDTFWERLVQPQIFLTMLFRFPDFERVARNDRWRDAIANGQYMLFRRASYDAVGGHTAVQDEVVEDLVMAQVVKRAGMRLRIRSAEDDLATRMYRSLAHLVEGWTKNIVIGGLQSLPRLLRPLAPPMALAGGVGLWVVPPVALIVSGLLILFGSDGSALGSRLAVQAVFLWSATVVALSVVLWSWFGRRMGAAARYGLLYPLGAGVVAFIFTRAWMRGRNVEWKGRTYRVRPPGQAP